MAGAAPSVTNLMMRHRDANARAVATNNVALKAEQAKDAVEREVQGLQPQQAVPKNCEQSLL